MATLGITAEAAPELAEERERFAALRPRQQVFLGVYFSALLHGKSRAASYAYRQAYNPKASAAVAAASSSRLLARGKVRDYLAGFDLETFRLVRRVFIEGMQAVIPVFRLEGGQFVKVAEYPDWPIRFRSAAALAELQGLYPKRAAKR